MLTLSKVVVEVGNRDDAARAGDYRLEPDAAPTAFARADYQLEVEQLGHTAHRPNSSMWLGAESALARFGVQRGDRIEREQLVSVLQGQHVRTSEQIRRPGSLKREVRDENGKTVLDEQGRPAVERISGVAHVEMTLSVPKSVSVVWAMANESDRWLIETVLIAAAERTVQYMARNKAVVHRRDEDGERIREPAAGAAIASSLHVTARRARGDRAPAPQLHVHNLVAGVIRNDGELVAADSWEWFRHDAALEGGALFRAQVADALGAAGWAVRSGTGDRGRYFEIDGVPESLCEVMSPRSREVEDARAAVERELGVRLHGGALAVLAKETRQRKDHDLDPKRLAQVWDALGQEHDFGPGAGSRIRQSSGHDDDVDERMRAVTDVVLRQLREQGPTVTLARARALVFEAAAGRITTDEAAAVLSVMAEPDSGELIPLVGGRVTSREIRAMEQYVMHVAVSGALAADATAVDETARRAGLTAADACLGSGRRLDDEQREAFELLTSPSGWVCLTGRAGTGKGPTLHAAAAAYQAAGWQVIACAMDGTTARRMAEQLGGAVPAMTVEQLKARLQAGAVKLDDNTVIFVDEASKLDTNHWAVLARTVDRHRASLRAVGHAGQHDAIRLPGLFTEMLRDERIPTPELRHIRRHRDPSNPTQVHPWLRDYQVAVDQGRGVDAVSILQEHNAINLYDTRPQAMAGLVAEWDSWRRSYQPTESALIVHGPNSDVDLVNEMAQRKRLDAGELGSDGVRAVDRDYLLRPGDVVSIRNAAYTFQARDDGSHPRRIENGQIAVVDGVDSDSDAMRLLVHEPGVEPRLVKVDQRRLRSLHASGQRAAAIRLAYAMHTFPAQGATLKATAALGGHWSQAKRETYVGDTRAIYRHTVHIAREDLGAAGTDEDCVTRYAQRITDERERLASIRSGVDPTLHLGPELPAQDFLPGGPWVGVAARPLSTGPSGNLSPRSVSRADGDSLHTTAPDSRSASQPAERIARERSEREAQLQACRHADSYGQTGPERLATPVPVTPTPRCGPDSPRKTSQSRRGPTVGR